MCHPEPPNILIRPSEVVPFDRGGGVVTIPYVGKWNSEQNLVITGQTVFDVGRGLPLHSHNVEESVLILPSAPAYSPSSGFPRTRRVPGVRDG